MRVLVPGPVEQRTGGYRYDRRLVESLREQGQPARIEALEGCFPDPDGRARESLAAALAGLGEAHGIVDHLAAGALGQIEASALPSAPPLLLVHHPFTDDPDLDGDLHDRLAAAEQAAFARCAGVIATSRFTAGRLAALGVEPARIRVVEPGAEPVAVVRRAQGGPVRLLCLASVTPRKGHDVLVEALAQLGDRDWYCRFAGSRRGAPEWARHIDARASELGVARRIEWAGELDDAALARAWEEADALVLASHYEGYGMAVAEALVHGLPVVTTTGGALGDTLPEDCGWKVPPGDPAALAGALAELIDRPGRRAARARAARQAGESLPGWDEQAARFAEAVAALGGD